jgi:hypothetical protein
MASEDKVKNVSGEDRIVRGRLVLAGALYELAPDEDVKSYTCQKSNWQSVKPSKTADSNDSQEG